MYLYIVYVLYMARGYMVVQLLHAAGLLQLVYTVSGAGAVMCVFALTLSHYNCVRDVSWHPTEPGLLVASTVSLLHSRFTLKAV